MENDTNSNIRNFKNEADKPFFAAYLNIAKQNIFIILRDISESLGLGFDLSNDDNMMNANLWEYIITNKEPETSQRIIEKLEKQLPFAKYLALNYSKFEKGREEVEPNDYFEVFEILIKQLYEYRNYYSHAVHEPVIMRKQLIFGMRMLFDASRSKVKERFSLKTAEVDHLVRLGMGGKEIRSFRYGFLDFEESLTEKGLAFFICLWLQRKYAQLFLKSLHGFKNSESPSQKATLEVFTHYSLRVPQPRLTSNTSAEGLLLDMINELKRCPKELYPLLSDEDRERFKIKIEDIEAEAEEEYEAMPILKRSSNRFFYFALRYLDTTLKNIKFHIDLGNYCFHVYEQEIEGDKRKRRWIKRMTGFGNLEDFADDNRPTDWKEKIQKLEDRKIENSDIYVTDTTPHYHINGQNIGVKFTDKYSELLSKNKIWPNLPNFDNTNNTGKPQNTPPDFWLSLYELPSMVFYKLLQQQNTKIDSIEIIIIKHRGKILKFFNDLENNKLPTNFTDATLKTELKNRGLEKSHIPKSIIKYLTSKTVLSFDTKASKRLAEQLKDTKERLNKVIRQKDFYTKKPGSKDYIEMKCGHMADFIARDLIRLQKPVNNMEGKSNGTEFQVLQAKIAFFGKNKETLAKTFRLCNLTDSANPHPFLDRIDINTCKGILDFYKKYLVLRQDFFKQCIGEKKYNDYHFLKLGEKSKNNGSEYIIKLAGKLQKEAVMNLPRGLFLKPIIEALKANNSTQQFGLELDKLERINVAYVIDKYLQQILNDTSQEFYSYKKSYEFLNKLNASPRKEYNTEDLARKTINLEKGQKDNVITRLIPRAVEQHCKREKIFDAEGKEKVKEQYMARYIAFTENEKQIRLAKNCDEVMFMMVDDIFRKNFVVDKGTLKKKSNQDKPAIQLGKGYKLGSIKPDSDEGFLSLQTRAELQIPYTYETSVEKVLKARNAESKKSPHAVKTIVKETIKIKNYGDFRGFLKDRRIISLLPYIPNNEIHFEALQKELELYQQARLEVFDRIFRFEKELTDAISIPKNSKGYIYHTDILKQKLDENDKRFGLIKELRNAFSHSNYPAYILFKNKIDGTQFNELKHYVSGDEDIVKKSLALQFRNLLIQYYDELTAI